MDRRIESQSSIISYKNGAKINFQTGTKRKNIGLRQDTDLKQKNTRAYTVSFSSDALQRSDSRFESTQNSDLKTFEIKQKIEADTKDRELEAEKKLLHQDQVTDKRQFQEKQRLDKIRYVQQQKQNS